jgi:hypothetical protein
MKFITRTAGKFIGPQKNKDVSEELKVDTVEKELAQHK